MLFNKVNRSQTLLFVPSCIDDYAPAGSKPRFIVETINNMDLSKLYEKYSRQGAEALDPAALLATWILAYSERVTSSRVLEAKCRRDFHYIYTSGDLQPNYSTLCRFRIRHADFLPEVMVEILIRAKERGLTDFKDIYTDGTKIQASCSSKQSKDAKGLQSLLDDVRREIDEYMALCDAADDVEFENEKAREAQKQHDKNLAREAHLLQCQEALEARKRELKPEHRDNHKINLVEPEARTMSGAAGKQCLPAYNAQVSVEGKNDFIVAEEVVTEPNDQQQLSRQVENVNQSIGEDPARKNTLDAGYHTKDELQKAEEKKLDLVVADPAPENRSTKSTPTSVDEILKQDRKVQRADFVFHKEDDFYQCPAGEKLEFRRAYKNGGATGRVYKKSTSCTPCPLFRLCVGGKSKSSFKQIHRDDREHYAEKMYEKLQTEEAKERLKNRRCTVEPAIGCLKQNMGFRRFRLRGLEKVKIEFLLMCLAYNFNKLFRLMQGSGAPRAAANANESPKEARKTVEILFCVFILVAFITYIYMSYQKYKKSTAIQNTENAH